MLIFFSVLLRCLSDGCVFHCQYSAFKNNKHENCQGQYCLFTDERETTFIVYDWSFRCADCSLNISCLIGGFDDHDIKMFLAVKFCYKAVQ